MKKLQCKKDEEKGKLELCALKESENYVYKNQIVRWPAATEPKRGSGMIDFIGNIAIIL
jgi:hypothetical protein